MHSADQEKLITDDGIISTKKRYGSLLICIICGILSLALIILSILSYLYAGGAFA